MIALNMNILGTWIVFPAKTYKSVIDFSYGCAAGGKQPGYPAASLGSQCSCSGLWPAATTTTGRWILPTDRVRTNSPYRVYSSSAGSSFSFALHT